MVKHDIHIHTHLSDCGDRKAFMSDYIASAKEIGLETIGFADHAWDDNVKGASGWYLPQTFKRLIARKAELKETDTEGIQILLGAEGEYAAELLGLTDEAAEFTDYILVPHSHTHMKGFVLPEDCIGNPEKHANYLVKSFISLCGHEKRKLFYGIVHPMYPIGEKYEYVKEIYSFISDEMLEECALAAKESGVSLEANITVIDGIPQSQENENCYRRFFDACNKAGCDFFMGSDSHCVSALAERHARQERVIKLCGLTEENFTIAKLRIPNG